MDMIPQHLYRSTIVGHIINFKVMYVLLNTKTNKKGSMVNIDYGGNDFI